MVRSEQPDGTTTLMGHLGNLEALLLVRDLFDRALAASADSSAFGRMLAPLLMDLSVETALKLVIADRGLDEPQSLAGQLTTVAAAVNGGQTMPGTVGVRTLRDERNLVQHQGTPRSREAIEKGLSSVDRLLTFLFPIAFGEDFPKLGARRLVEDVYAGKALDDGEGEFTAGRYDAAIALAGLALQMIEAAAEAEWGALKTLSGKEASGSGDPAVKAVVVAIALGYDVAGLAQFRSLVVQRIAQMAPTGDVTMVLNVSGATEAEARLALDFATFNCARLERRLPSRSVRSHFRA